jgi:hypothetical protein
LNDANAFWLIVNSASGSNTEQTVADLLAAFEQAGRRLDRVIDCVSEDLPERSEIEAGGVGTVAIFTGDGTVSAMIPKLEGWPGLALVLPGGTANLLANFGADKLEPSRRSCIRFSGHVALIEVLAGPGATWSDVREGLREGDIGEVATKTIEAVRHSTDGARVAVAQPALGEADGYDGVRMTPTDDGLLIDGYRSDTVSDYLKQGLALLMRDFREGPHDKLGVHPAAVCRSVDGAPIELMIDGERETGPTALTFELAVLDVNLLASPHG